jgi:hypothetical protein
VRVDSVAAEVRKQIADALQRRARDEGRAVGGGPIERCAR